MSQYLWSDEDNAFESDLSDDDKNGTDSIQDSGDEEDTVFLWKPQTTDKMGEWEQYTKVTLTCLIQKYNNVNV